MSANSGQGDMICTPRRAQKCLFGIGSSSSRRSDGLQSCNDNNGLSEEDSDIGPMSPLALTDQSPSTTNSSSGREYASPFASPTKSICRNDVAVPWDRLTPRSNKHSLTDYVPPFSALKKITKAARHSPRRKIITNSPKSLPSTPRKGSMSGSVSSESLDRTLVSEEIVPETPHRNFGMELQNDVIIETPRKSQDPELILITPLGSASKTILLPKLHRRKSLGTFDMEVDSPERKENVLKRHAQETLASTVSKLLKTDDYCTIPKARASLFQEKNDMESKLKNFTLSTKSFYSNSSTKKSVPMNYTRVKELNQFKKRRSLPTSGNYKRRSLRDRFGVINAGVFHRIKKPKPKSASESKKRAHNAQPSEEIKSTNESSPELAIKNVSLVPPPAPEIDETKRFFKTNGTLKQYNIATVTVSRNIKLKVADGKIALNEKNGKVSKNVHKRPKLTDISFDATDLTVHEPNVETAMEQINVANILKVLEDDWKDDEYDSLECLTDPNAKNVSPLKSVTLPKDVTMSPASELSNMTSTMNIEDPSGPTTFENISFNASKESVVEVDMNAGKKYYPLFTKAGYTAESFNDTSPGVKSGCGVKRPAKWQLSAKGAGGENQYQLDVGQKRFGATQCPECNVIYQLGEPEDENAHLNYHNSITILKFHGWKKERVVIEDPFTSSRIILVEPGDSKQCWKKVSEVLQVVDRDLGLVDAQLSEYHDKKIYLYIRDKNILGVLVAESIKSAHRMIPELLELDCCTAESTPAKCGINVVWTAMSHRRQGIATKLVDVLRAKYYYGYIMSMDDIAFSTPTPSGKIFAEKYTKMRNFKVYSQ